MPEDNPVRVQVQAVAPEPPAPSLHWLEIVVKHWWELTLMFVAGLGATVFALWVVVKLLIQNSVEIPNVFQAAVVAQQVTVPAAAGWVAVNPDKPFDPGAEMSVSVSGRVHLAMHQAVAAARLGDEFFLPPPVESNCRLATNYLHSLGRWTTGWRTADDPAAAGGDSCRLSPKQPGGRLVYVVLKDQPDLSRLGPVPISENYDGVIKKGFLDSRNHLSLPQGGYMLLAVNDRRNCSPNDIAHINAKALAEYLEETPHCNFDGSVSESSSNRSLARFYDMSEQFVANAAIGDNMGEYFVHITMR